MHHLDAAGVIFSPFQKKKTDQHAFHDQELSRRYFVLKRGQTFCDLLIKDKVYNKVNVCELRLQKSKA
jgi:hypothetical protein